MNLSILALDLGNCTGWAQGSGTKDSVSDCGSVLLGSAKEVALSGKSRMARRLDFRIPRLYQWLEKRYESDPFDWVSFEDVLFASSRMQAHLWASFRATVWLFAGQRAINIECVDTSALKLFATGSGASQKQHMAAALVKRDPKFLTVNGEVNFVRHKKDFFLDDNAVDAVHLLKWTQYILQHRKNK